MILNYSTTNNFCFWCCDLFFCKIFCRLHKELLLLGLKIFFNVIILFLLNLNGTCYKWQLKYIFTMKIPGFNY